MKLIDQLDHRRLMSAYLQLVELQPRAQVLSEKFVSMEPWFTAWLQIMSIPATHPTGRARTQEEIDECLKHGRLF